MLPRSHLAAVEYRMLQKVCSNRPFAPLLRRLTSYCRFPMRHISGDQQTRIFGNRHPPSTVSPRINICLINKRLLICRRLSPLRPGPPGTILMMIQSLPSRFLRLLFARLLRLHPRRQPHPHRLPHPRRQPHPRL